MNREQNPTDDQFEQPIEQEFQDMTAGAQNIIRDETFFLRDREILTGPQQRLWVFDADDTLWEDNYLFEIKIEALIDHAVSHQPQFNREELRQLIDDVEHEVMAVHGYGPRGFAISMRKAFERIAQNHAPGIPPCEELLESVLPSLTEEPRQVIAGTFETLRALNERGDALVLYTKGPLDLQLGKVDSSELEDLFHAISVVQKKDSTHLSRLLESLPFSSHDVRAVGNSLRSDITPAVELGIRSYYFINEHTWRIEDKNDLSEKSYQSINDLRELLNECEEE